jgi:hypothetical protein
MDIEIGEIRHLTLQATCTNCSGAFMIQNATVQNQGIREESKPKRKIYRLWILLFTVWCPYCNKFVDEYHEILK